MADKRIEELEDDLQTLWIEKRLEPAIRRQKPINLACRARFLGWQNYLDLSRKDPEQAQVQLPRAYTAIEQAANVVTSAYVNRRPWLPLASAPWVEDPAVKQRAKHVTNLIQSCLEDQDANSEMILDRFFKETFLYGNCGIETGYDSWEETYSGREERGTGDLTYQSTRTQLRRLRQGTRLRVHPKWRIYFPEAGSFVSEVDWFIIIEFLSEHEAKYLLEEFRDDLDPSESQGSAVEAFDQYFTGDVKKTLMNWTKTTMNVDNRAMLVRCFENGRDPYYVEYLNGKHVIRTYERFTRRWPVEFSRFTTEPRDNNLYSMPMVQPAEHSWANMDAVLSTDLDLRFWAAEPPVFYDANVAKALASSGRLSRRARIPVDVGNGQSIGDYIHIAPTIPPVDPGPSYGAMEGSADQVTNAPIGSGIEPRSLKTAKVTSEVAETINEAEGGRLRILGIPLERIAENSGEMTDLLMPYDEMALRIGPEAAAIVHRLGADTTSFPGGGHFDMDAPRRKQLNRQHREELRGINEQWSQMLQNAEIGGSIVELARADMELTEALTPEQIEKILPSAAMRPSMPVQVGNARPIPPKQGGPVDTQAQARQNAAEASQ